MHTAIDSLASRIVNVRNGRPGKSLAGVIGNSTCIQLHMVSTI